MCVYVCVCMCASVFGVRVSSIFRAVWLNGWMCEGVCCVCACVCVCVCVCKFGRDPQK